MNSKGDECDLVGEELTLSFAAVVDQYIVDYWWVESPQQQLQFELNSVESSCHEYSAFLQRNYYWMIDVAAAVVPGVPAS